MSELCPVEEISTPKTGLREGAALRPFQRIADLFRWFVTNPITLREFVRSARSQRFWLLMAFLLIVGTLILCVVWSNNQFEDPILPIGRRLFYFLIMTEFLIILILLPGIVAHSLITEREQDTYPLLLTTPLSPGRIIAGKLISTLGVMILLIISTFPLIGICVARGGVSPGEMILAWFYLVFACFIIASFSIYHALEANNTLNAILMTHLTLFVSFVVGCATLAFALGIFYSLVGIITELAAADYPSVRILQNTLRNFWYWSVLLLSTIGAFWVTVRCIRSSQNRLHYVEPQVRMSWEMNRFPSFRFGQPLNPKENRLKPRSWWEFEDGMNPFSMRERLSYAAASTFSTPSSWYVIILLCHVLFLLTPISEGKWVAFFTLLAIAQMIPAYAGPLFAREKEQNTWEMLLTTVCQTRAILHGKLFGALSQCLPRAAVLFILPFSTAFLLYTIIQFISGNPGHLFTLPLIFIYAILLFTQLFFILMATTFYSLHLPRAGSAITAGYTTIFVAFTVPFLLGITVQRMQIPLNSEILYSLTPLYLIYSIPTIDIAYLIEHVLFYGFITTAFYFLCIQHLKRLR